VSHEISSARPSSVLGGVDISHLTEVKSARNHRRGSVPGKDTGSIVAPPCRCQSISPSCCRRFPKLDVTS
jgi:hypothetical protein